MEKNNKGAECFENLMEQINYCFSKFETKIKIFSDNYKFKSLLKYDKFIKTIHPDRKPKYDINMYKRYHRYTNGYFDPNEMEICILFPDLNKMQQLLFTILHEYGHYIAYKNNEYLNFLLSSEIFLKERRYGCGGFASDIIFQDEISAWENAECWAHKHKIPLNNEYIDIKYYSLSTYNKEKTIKYFQNINK